MSTTTLKTLLRWKQTLDEELDQLTYRRSLLRTQAERLKLIPEAVRITGAIIEVERQIERWSKSKPKQ